MGTRRSICMKEQWSRLRVMSANVRWETLFGVGCPTILSTRGLSRLSKERPMGLLDVSGNTAQAEQRAMPLDAYGAAAVAAAAAAAAMAPSSTKWGCQLLAIQNWIHPCFRIRVTSARWRLFCANGGSIESCRHGQQQPECLSAASSLLTLSSFCCGVHVCSDIA